MTREERFRVLRDCSVLRSVASEDVRLIADMVVEERFQAGESVCKIGETADRVFVVADGRLAIRLPGDEATSIERARADMIGEYGLFHGGVRTASVTAVTDARVMSLDYTRFRSFLHKFPDAMFAVAGTMVGQLLATTRRP